MPVGAAIGIGSLGSGIAGAVGANNAANTQAKAANNAANMQLGMFNTIRGDLAPYRSIGTAAAPIYSALLGLPSNGGAFGSVSPGQSLGANGSPDWASYVNNNPDVLAAYNQYGKPQGTSLSDWGQWHWNTFGQNEFNSGDANRAYTPYGPANYGGSGSGANSALSPDAIQSALAATPGYQFTLGQGEQEVNNKLASQGLGGLSGSLGKGLARFVTGLADSTYGERLKNYADAVGVGQSAANQTGAYGTSATQGAASSLIGGANATAAGQLGVANSIGGIASGAGNGYLTSRILGMYGPQSSGGFSYGGAGSAMDPNYADLAAY